MWETLGTILAVVETPVGAAVALGVLGAGYYAWRRWMKKPPEEAKKPEAGQGQAAK